MRRKQMIYRLFAVLCILLSVSSFIIDGVSQSKKSKISITGETISLFPALLQVLEEEAFWGTSLRTIVFCEKIEYIGEQAFACSVMINDVYLPESIMHIGKDAFPNDIVVHCINNSFAQKWANEHAINFVVDNIWSNSAITETIHFDVPIVTFFAFFPIDEKDIKRVKRRICKYVRCMRPKNRPELNPIDYKFP